MIDGYSVALANQFSIDRLGRVDGEFVVGFMTGHAAATTEREVATEHWRRVSEHLWWGALQALLLLEPSHPARRSLEQTLDRYRDLH